MRHKPYKGFEPKWVKTPAPADSYRSIFRWGDPEFVKYPKESLFKMMKEKFQMTDEDFKTYAGDIGMDSVKLDRPCQLQKAHLEAFRAIVGSKNVTTEDYPRLAVAYGKTGYDAARLREKRVDSLPDVVLYPSETEEIEKIVAYCTKHSIPLYVYGGGSSVTRGVEPIKGGVSLDMRKNFNRVLSFNETDQTITVQSGISGPQLEDALENAPARFGARRAYTCGHFPQSFEYSSVGGWVVTRGAGQNSTYYGCITDIVLSQKYATPIGVIQTSHYPREATGPDLNQIMMGGEGAFGVLTEVTLKVFRYMPENRKRFSYIFKDWETARKAAREMMQCEAGYSSVFRLSDAEETNLMLRLYNVDETPLWKLLDLRGYEDMRRCLFLGFTDGEKGFSKNVAKNIRRIAHRYGGMSLTSYVTKSWEKGRFNDPYLRDTMLDFGVMTDTLECSVNWSNMGKVHKEVRAVCHALPNTIVTTHMSHCYPQGANLYFIFITKMSDAEAFKAYHATILDAIQKSGAAMSHHHGIGKMFAPWLEGQIGRREYGVYRALKNYFDPGYNMNPGGTLGLDLEEGEKRFLKEIEN
ncbi:FAD-binding oxidoreductase [Eubacterium callanderi]|uniref:Putative FAD-linked oxidoreductase n=1 Tax=Eubacterium limosum TaxID=1736 RepID=A0A6N2Y5N6_EUBLI|nr:FAD-binding oxidoreductase [Eubacterium callanderi]MBO1704092.1 FAD-binding oxidoreductase [Eubacterium callanderi]MDR4074940.1 FAD-binding oxidoreductase [Eubacterium sp.]